MQSTKEQSMEEAAALRWKVKNYSTDNFEVFKVTSRLLTIVYIFYQGKIT